MKSNNQTIPVIDEVQVLGCAWGYIPVIFDVVCETLGTQRFKIYQNIEVEDLSDSELSKQPYEYTIHSPGQPPDLTQSHFIFGVDGPYAKFSVFSFFEKNFGFLCQHMQNIIHPTAYISSTAIFSHGIFCEPGVIISSQSRIGFGVTIKRGVSIGHHNVIGDYVEINPGVTISGHVQIGRGCIIGVGAIIKNGVSIGENTFIGMGSLVNQDIPPGVVAYGSPCRIIRPNDKKPV
jgi:sugar O-acyltransferase (sialic acid O-acetyltransferase NeuD family)